jgi:hypothetical protein
LAGWRAGQFEKTAGSLHLVGYWERLIKPFMKILPEIAEPCEAALTIAMV